MSREKKTVHPLITELTEFKAEFKKKAQNAIKAEFKAFFAKHPQVTSIVWAQYTPYFNDGDACTFSVNEMEFKGVVDASSKSPVSEKYEYGEACAIRALNEVTRTRETYDYEKKKYVKIPARAEPHTPEELELINDHQMLTTLVHGLDETMKDVFGDHAVITASVAGFDIEAFEHD